MKNLTIFTPTYNRKNTLPRLYESLINQKNSNFIWLVVDDGSSDGTKELISTWKKENKIEINYIYQENHGKTFAHNVGVLNTTTNWFLCLDSDDYLDVNAVQIIDDVLKSKNEDFIGILSLKSSINRENVSLSKSLNTGEIISFEDLYRKYNYRGDTALIYKTSLLRDNLFPIIQGEKFVPEQYLHDCMSAFGKLYYINKPLYYCEYLEDGYTNNTGKLLKKNPQGLLITGEKRLETGKKIKSRMIGATQVNIASIILKKHLLKYAFKYSFFNIILLICTWVPSYIHYKKKY